MYGVRAPGLEGSGAPGCSVEEQDGFKTEQQLGRRRRPDKKPAPPHRRRDTHRRPLQRRRRPDVDPPPPMQMPMTMVVPRRCCGEEVQHINHRRASHISTRRPRQVVKYMGHRRMETSTRVRATVHADAARRMGPLHCDRRSASIHTEPPFINAEKVDAFV